MSPAKTTYKPPDLQNDLHATQNRLRASRYVSKPLPYCLHAPHFDLHLVFLFYVYLYQSKIKYIYLYSRLRNTLKNRLIDKF